jgi:hypothetical protein
MSDMCQLSLVQTSDVSKRAFAFAKTPYRHLDACVRVLHTVHDSAAHDCLLKCVFVTFPGAFQTLAGSLMGMELLHRHACLANLSIRNTATLSFKTAMSE